MLLVAVCQPADRAADAGDAAGHVSDGSEQLRICFRVKITLFITADRNTVPAQGIDKCAQFCSFDAKRHFKLPTDGRILLAAMKNFHVPCELTF